MQVVLLLIVGAAAGFLATRMMKMQTDIPTTIAIGVGGAIVTSRLGGAWRRSLAAALVKTVAGPALAEGEPANSPAQRA